jgi:GntR family transcriptional regulator
MTDLINLNHDSPEPLYSQVKAAILEFIEMNNLVSDDVLPSERELCSKLGVSRLTIRKAVDDLIQVGVLVRRAGKGTYVNQPKLQQRLLVVTSFSDAISKEGHVPGSQLLEILHIPASSKMAKNMCLQPGTPLLRMKRLRFVDFIPFSLGISYIPYHLVPGIEDKLQSHSFYWLLENEYHLKLSKTQAHLEATLADQYFSNYLNVKIGSPLFLMTGNVCDQDLCVIEHFEAYYRGDRIRFTVESD